MAWFRALLLFVKPSLLLSLLLLQIKSQQIMVVGNIVFFLGLAIIGGSWMPVTMFPNGHQVDTHLSYQSVSSQFRKKGEFHGNRSFLSWFATIATGLALLSNRTESDHACSYQKNDFAYFVSLIFLVFPILECLVGISSLTLVSGLFTTAISFIVFEKKLIASGFPFCGFTL